MKKLLLLVIGLCLPLTSGCGVLKDPVGATTNVVKGVGGVVLSFGEYASDPKVWLDAYAGANSGDTSVKGYTKEDGTYVAPHYRSKADRSFENNWSTKGSVNPYTGKAGSRKTKP